LHKSKELTNLLLTDHLAREFAAPLASLRTQQKEVWGTTPFRVMILHS